MESANEVCVNLKQGNGDLTSKQGDLVGGQMVKKTMNLIKAVLNKNNF